MPQYIDLLNRLTESHDGDDYFDPEVLAQAGRQNDRSREILTHMSPEDFLAVAGRGLDASKTAKIDGFISQGVKFNEIPFLSFVHDGHGTAVVTDHNGRHRARALMARGVKSMPVVIASQGGGGGLSLRWGSLDHEYDGYDGEWPQTLRGQRGDIPGHEHNAVAFPLADLRKRNLTEGLIKVPPGIHRQCRDYVTRMVMWWAQDRIKDRVRELPEFAREFDRLRTERCPDLPRPDVPFPDETVDVEIFTVDWENLDGSYRRLKPVRNKILFGIDWRPDAGEDALGVWMPQRSAIIIYPMKIPFLRQWPRDHPENLQLGLDQLDETLTHELRHMVQALLLGPVDPRQTEVSDDYDKRSLLSGKRGAGYNTSPIEFDTTIGSHAQQFVMYWKLLESYGRNTQSISTAIKRVVGALKGDDTYPTEPFFRDWKRKDPRKWRIAVNKFITEVHRLLAT